MNTHYCSKYNTLPKQQVYQPGHWYGVIHGVMHAWAIGPLGHAWDYQSHNRQLKPRLTRNWNGIRGCVNSIIARELSPLYEAKYDGVLLSDERRSYILQGKRLAHVDGFKGRRHRAAARLRFDMFPIRPVRGPARIGDIFQTSHRITRQSRQLHKPVSQE